MRLRSWLCTAAVIAAVLCVFGADASAQSVLRSVPVTPAATAYASGNCLGGVLTLPSVLRGGGSGGAILQNIGITDSTGLDIQVDVFLFTAQPTGTYSDGAACSIAAADQPSVVGPFHVTDCSRAGTPGLCNAPQLAQVIQAGSAFPLTATALWAVPIVRGTPTYGASAALVFNFGFLLDPP